MKNEISITNEIWAKVSEIHGNAVTDAFLSDFVDQLKQCEFHLSFDWGWVLMMAADPEKKNEFLTACRESLANKKKACEMCGYKEGTKYHIYIGNVCPDCLATLPIE